MLPHLVLARLTLPGGQGVMKTRQDIADDLQKHRSSFVRASWSRTSFPWATSEGQARLVVTQRITGSNRSSVGTTYRSKSVCSDDACCVWLGRS
jgi:hypothetical protein